MNIQPVPTQASLIDSSGLNKTWRQWFISLKDNVSDTNTNLTNNYPTNTDLSAQLANYYTKIETQNLLDNYVTDAEFIAGLSNYYTKTEIDTLLSNYYTKNEIDADLELYLKLAGRQGGQTAYGGTGVNDALELYANSNITNSGIIYLRSETAINSVLTLYNDILYQPLSGQHPNAEISFGKGGATTDYDCLRFIYGRDDLFEQEIRYQYRPIGEYGTQIITIGDFANSYQGYLLVQGSNVSIGNTHLNPPGDDYTKTISINDDGNVAIGVEPVADYLLPDNKLDINGKIKIRGGSPATGKILTCSDNNGLAIWTAAGSISGVSHHTLSDLTNYDDHSQYLYLPGRGGTQTILDNVGLYHTTATTSFDVESGSNNAWMGTKVAVNKYGWLYFGDNVTYGWQMGKDTSDNFWFYSISTTPAKNGYRFYIDKYGNFGLNTTTPNLLHAGSNSTTLTINGVDTGVIEFAANNVLIGRFQAQSGSMNFVYEGSGYITFETNSAERARITAAGYFGIGTNTPIYLLHVQNTKGYLYVGDGTGLSTVEAAQVFQNGGNAVYFGIENSTGTALYSGLSYAAVLNSVGANNKLAFMTGGTSSTNVRMTIDYTGYVGIGTTNPASLQHNYGSGELLRLQSTTVGTAGVFADFSILSLGATQSSAFYEMYKIEYKNNSYYSSDGLLFTSNVNLFNDITGMYRVAATNSATFDINGFNINSLEADINFYGDGVLEYHDIGTFQVNVSENVLFNSTGYFQVKTSNTERLRIAANGSSTFYGDIFTSDYTHNVTSGYGTYTISSSYKIGTDDLWNFHSVGSNSTLSNAEETAYWWGVDWTTCIVNLNMPVDIRTGDGLFVYTNGGTQYIGTMYCEALPNDLAFKVIDTGIWNYKDVYIRDNTLTQQVQFDFGTNYFGITSTKDSGYTQEIRYEYANVSVYGTQILKIGNWANSFQGYLYVQGGVTAIGNADGSPTTDGTNTININSYGKVGVGVGPYDGYSSSYQPKLYVNGTTRTDATIIKLTAGETISRGMLVYVKDSGGTDGRVYKNPISGIKSIGIAYDDATSGNDILVVISGICYVLPDSTLTATRGYTILPSSTTAGYAAEGTGISSGMIGFWLDTGSGNGAITRAVLKIA